MKRTVYDDDQEAFRQTVRTFIAKEVTPHFESWMEAGRVPRDLFTKLADLGATGFDIPEELGGAGPTSYKYQAILTEEANRAAVGIGHYSVSIGIVLPYLLRLATEEQKQRWLPGIASGETMLCIAMTEPGTGSDLAGIRTTARLSEDGRHYVLNGAKTFITGALNSELCVVVARTSPATADDRRFGLSLLVVPIDTEGFAFGRKLDKLGLRASDTNELSFTDVLVPAENLLGEQDRGFSYLGQNLPRERLAIAVGAVSMAQSAISHAQAYVEQREVFGRTVATFQNTKFELAACDTDVLAAQLMVDWGLALDEAGTLTAADAARIKLFCTETSQRVIDRCLQLHGGYGYMLEYPIARLYADTRVQRIYGGTSEVMKTIIAKDMGL
ncbi:acyl-CoA dehydrogenase family protein [Mumia sp. Pv 4-285]|uniref:acyl-CoA dehydrogenase family protein n=1 Tax=Mumia qirimensis TaxID=3234852 RepID=UPI00351CE15E